MVGKVLARGGCCAIVSKHRSSLSVVRGAWSPAGYSPKPARHPFSFGGGFPVHSLGEECSCV